MFGFKGGSIGRPNPENGLDRTTAFCVQRPMMDNGPLPTKAYTVQHFLYNGPQKEDIGLFRTTDFKTWDNGPMIQWPLKTSQRPLKTSQRPLKIMIQRPLKTLHRPLKN